MTSHRTVRAIVLWTVIASVGLLPLAAQPDLYIRDDDDDDGTEPNLTTGPLYLSPDIWVRRDPMPGWNPYPYSSASPPTWMNPPLEHEDPDYRGPHSGRPHYVYVRVRNTGTASPGTERLLLYWASVSTGLGWDPLKVGGSFIDNVTGGVLFGAEITKPRKNAATASLAERNAYVAAVIKIATDPALVFPGGDSYWHTQQEIHRYGPTNRHGTGNPFVPSVAFLPWHREYINRYEALLQEADPKLKLLYWNWNDHPVSGPLDLFTSTFMGASGLGAPSGVPIGAPLSPATDPLYPHPLTLATQVVRRMEPAVTTQADATVVARSAYDSSVAANDFSGGLERFSHNGAHRFLGGYWGPAAPIDPAQGGDHLLQPLAARDPSFFLLHGKVDELWARWQRKALFNLDPATTYNPATMDTNLNVPMGPWDGTATGGPQIPPWIFNSSYLLAKTARDRSVTSPPFYDTAPLTIPALGPGEEVVMEIPWYPPNPASFGAVFQPEHVCLLARIESSTSTPFGMTMTETTDLGFNTQQNNNIAWRNISILDTFPGPFKIATFWAGNVSPVEVATELRLGAAIAPDAGAFFERGTVRMDLGRELFARWRSTGGRGHGIEVQADGRTIRLRQPDAALENIPLAPGERFPITVTFELAPDYRPTARGELLTYDIVQVGTPQDPRAVVGGQRYQVGLEKLVLVEKGRRWRFAAGLRRAPAGWPNDEVDDSDWAERKLDLGLVDPATCPGANDGAPATTYFRHSFEVADPQFIRNLVLRVRRGDGAIAYLNGREVYRANLPDGPVNAWTPALRPAGAAEREAFYPAEVDRALLVPGRNVLAVEVHRAAGGPGVAFDLELDANWESPRHAPVVKLMGLADGELITVGRTATLDFDAVDPDGAVRTVTVMMDGKVIGRADQPPFRFNWTVRPGPHRLTAIATDESGEEARTYATLTGVRNVPPTVELTQPSPDTSIVQGEPLVAVARAADPDGTIRRVDFFIHDSVIFGDSARLAGSATRAPFMVTLKGLRPGHAMVTAVAHDNGGARTASIPVMVMVAGKEPEKPTTTDDRKWKRWWRWWDHGKQRGGHVGHVGH